MNTKRPGIRSVILVGYKAETEHFKEISLYETEIKWFQRLFGKSNEVARVKDSTQVVKLGVRTFCDLPEVPYVFSKIGLPVIVNGMAQCIPLVVLRVESPKKLFNPFVIHCAFDFGYTKDEMDACSVKNQKGSIDEITFKWNMNNALKLSELYKAILTGKVYGLTEWYKVKTTPA